MARLPKDYLLAERAYNAFHNEQPQLWFTDLSHEYQMRWVRAIRAIVEEDKKYRRSPESVQKQRMTLRLKKEKAQ